MKGLYLGCRPERAPVVRVREAAGRVRDGLLQVQVEEVGRVGVVLAGVVRVDGRHEHVERGTLLAGLEAVARVAAGLRQSTEPCQSSTCLSLLSKF